MTIAFTHPPSSSLADCELTFLERNAIDVGRARQQHEGYCRALTRMGAKVTCWSFNSEFADCAFVEDLAIILEQLAIICSPQPASRRDETGGVAHCLAEHVALHRIELPATIEGGDVLKMGRTLFVGESCRTSREGIEALRTIVAPLQYEVIPVPVSGCLHLKTACTGIDDETLLVNPHWIDTSCLHAWNLLEVPASEPFAANVLRISGELCLSTSHPRAAELLDLRGCVVHTVDISEFEKAEAGVTCMSLLLSTN